MKVFVIEPDSKAVVRFCVHERRAHIVAVDDGDGGPFVFPARSGPEHGDELLITGLARLRRRRRFWRAGGSCEGEGRGDRAGAWEGRRSSHERSS